MEELRDELNFIGEQLRRIADSLEHGGPVSPNGSGAHVPQAPGETKHIEVESIDLAQGGDNPRWVIRGGNFKQYGITCWKEVLEQAGIAKHLNPMESNTPNGQWRAYYTEKPSQNDASKMVPDKVVKLEKF